MIFTALALVNVGPDNYSGYTKDAPLAFVSHRVTGAPVYFFIEAHTPSVALEWMFDIGNGQATDRYGRNWPSDVRSLSVGDVVALTPGVPNVGGGHDFCKVARSHAVAGSGFLRVVLSNPIVPIEGTSATSRHRAGPSASWEAALDEGIGIW